MVYKFWKVEHFFYKIKLIPIAILIRAVMRLLFSCDIPYQVEMGKNVEFPHLALGITIHSHCKIRR